MNATPQYWFMLAGLVSLTIAAFVALHRSRSWSSLLFGCAAGLALFSLFGLMLERLFASETLVSPNGAVRINYNATFHTIMDWAMMIAAVLAVVGSAAYVLLPSRLFRSSADKIANQAVENQRLHGGSDGS